MKTIYQTFEEIAEDMVNGELLAHQLSEHSSLICEVWQTAIKEFAKALDGAGIKVEEKPEVYEKFWENLDKAFVEWKSGLNRRQPYSKCLGEISLEEAKQRYNFKGGVGGRVIIPRCDWNEVSEDYYIVKK